MKIFVAIFFSLLTLYSGAQTVNITDSCKKAYGDIISLRFKNAQKLLENEKKLNPTNLYPDYLNSYIEFLKVFISEDKSVYDEYLQNREMLLEKLELLPENNEYKNYLLSNVSLQTAIAESKFGDYFSAAYNVRKSFLEAKENYLRFPDFKLQLITLSVLHILIGMIPDKYHWLLSLISMEGTVPQGLDELDTVLFYTKKYPDEFGYLKSEILFYMGFVEMNIGINEKKKQILMSEIEPLAEENHLLGFLYVNMLRRGGENDKALSLLNNIIDNNDGYYEVYYLNYLRADCKLRKLESNSKNDFEYFLKNFKGINYIKDAKRKIAWGFLIQGDTAGYLKNIKEVERVGNLFVGIDKEAQKEAQSGRIPNVDLLKARLLFDGGYYDRALNQLALTDTTGISINDRVEYFYRKGRIFDKKGDFDDAVYNYNLAIAYGKNIKRYFAGNSALMLGRIYEKKGDFDKALKYYNLCRSLDFDEFENSIKEKAKQGIERIKENRKNG